jgi:hypothetical protein
MNFAKIDEKGLDLIPIFSYKRAAGKKVGRLNCKTEDI